MAGVFFVYISIMSALSSLYCEENNLAKLDVYQFVLKCMLNECRRNDTLIYI